MYEYKNFRPLDYLKTGERIRTEREKLSYKLQDGQLRISSEGKKLSQEKLLQYMDEQKLPHFGRNTLSKLENGDPEAFSTVTLAQWEALCSVFSCSIGFLFGEYDCRSFDREFIKDETGLSEKAIIHLKQIQSETRSNGLMDVINVLLEDFNLEYILTLFSKRFSYSPNQNDVQPEIREINGVSHLVNAKEYHADLQRKETVIDIDGSRFLAQKRNLLDSLLTAAIIDRMTELSKAYNERQRPLEDLRAEFHSLQKDLALKEIHGEITEDEAKEQLSLWMNNEQ